MRHRSAVGALSVAVLAAGALACAATIDAATVRDELVRQTGRTPASEFEWNLGLTARLALGALGTKPEDVFAIRGLTGLEVALYDVGPVSPGGGEPLDLAGIDRRGWETVVRFRDAQSSALVVVQPAGDAIGKLVLVGSGRNQVLYARLEGRLDASLPDELGKSVMSRGPEATKNALIDPAAAQDPAGARGTPEVQTRASQAALTPARALERLAAGNLRFASNQAKPRDGSAQVAATAAGQFPFAAVLACMDSRAPVEIVFDQGLGDVFGVRVAGNVVNDDELGSLEYAVKVGAKLLVVLGHTRCGAVQGALDRVQLGNLTGLLEKIQPAVEAAGCRDAKQEACVTKVAEENVRHSMQEIRARSPYLAKHLDEGSVELVGAMYDVTTGRVTFLGK